MEPGKTIEASAFDAVEKLVLAHPAQGVRVVVAIFGAVTTICAQHHKDGLLHARRMFDLALAHTASLGSSET